MPSFWHYIRGDDIKKRNKIFYILWFILITSISLSSSFLLSCNQAEKNNTYITHVIDGDTFEDEDKTRYRLLGVDTPESYNSSNNFKPTFGIQKLFATKATNLTIDTILNKYVHVKKWKKDIYKRVVARIQCGEISLAKLLLLKGLARVKYISPDKDNFFYYYDIDYYKQLIEIESYAKINKIGIWSLSTNEIKIVFPK